MSRAKKAADTPLSRRAQLFVVEYLVDLNATKAAERAGYSAKTAGQQGERLLRDRRVAAAIEAEMKARATRTKTSGDRVIKELWELASADPNELVEYRRTCCRYCYGVDFGYQMTQRELDERRALQQRGFDSRKDKKPTDVLVFDDLGGPGFDARKAPNPACPECFGEGVGHMHLKDTRALSPAARRLYAGVKSTKEGIEVRMLDQFGALVQLGRHYGLFVDKVKLEEDITEDELERRVVELLRTAAARKKAGIKPSADA